MPIERHFECDFQRGGYKPVESSLRHAETSLSLHISMLPFLLVCSAIALAVPTLGQSVDESEVKAAYLYNFTKFVEWPSAMFANSNEPFVICVLGEEHTSDVLEQSIQGKKANGRSIRMRRPHSLQEFKSCHVLFVGFSDKDRTAKVLHDLRGSSVLTVGQSEDFLPLGGMINMNRHDRNIELEIDPEIPGMVGLKVSSRLLVVARIVKIQHETGTEK